MTAEISAGSCGGGVGGRKARYEDGRRVNMSPLPLWSKLTTVADFPRTGRKKTKADLTKLWSSLLSSVWKTLGMGVCGEE